MNILFVHEVDWLNKVVYEIHNLAEILSVQNHKVFAVDYSDVWQHDGFLGLGSLKNREYEAGSRAVPGSSVTVRHPGFIKIPGLSRVTGSFNQYRLIARTLKAEHIDVIMLYSIPTNGLQTLHLAAKHGVPVVFRSIDILHKLVRYPSLRRPTHYLEKKIYPKVDAILGITPNHVRYVISLGADPERVRLLPLPIDTSVFRPGVDTDDIKQKWSISEHDKVVVFIGTLFPFSGLDGFIRAFPRVLARVPEARLLIVGDGPQRSTLEGIIAELGLGDRVTVTGFQPYQTMPQYINLATVCINPFLDTPETHDIFPGKIVQYVACGRATVATPLLGITCLLEDGEKGVVYAATPETMADKVTALLASDEARERLEMAGLDYVREVHDQRKIGRQLEEELERVVAEHAERRAA